ncbi:EAL domain-containing protein [Agrobacterium cavarae]|uniref:EAL domain-containing protein n=2 Tax=Agrobacterium cavarae TaxID=2528239 RepID=A0ABY1Y5Z7_9HYPH|nr:EAL domain-containing protein [Agrobacterium cavarae]
MRMIGRRSAVAGVLFAFALIVTLITALVLSALTNVTQMANRLDEERSLQTARGALSTFQHQLGATLNDYAAWDDAARFVYAEDGAGWIISNYGDMTVNSELFDTAVVLDDQEGVLLAYQNGAPAPWSVGSYFGGSISEMINRIRNAGPEATPEMTGFIRTRDGIAAAGVALVRKKSGELDPSLGKRYLVFVRHLTDDKVAKLGQTYLVNGLSLEPGLAATPYYVDIVDPHGDILGKLTWTSTMPGDVSLNEVRPRVLTAFAIVGVFFLVLFVFGLAVIRKLRREEAVMREELLVDRLSGLHNRPGLFRGLKRMTEAANADGSYVELIYLDLDGFKDVNDSFGHEVGDLLIKAVAAALKVLAPKGALLARLGGDEFAVALQGPNARIEGRMFCDALLELVSEPFMLGDRVAAIGCSIGTAVSKGGDINGEELLRRADMAMYEAKEGGGGRYFAYQADLDARREERKQLEADLKYGIDNNEIRVAFQPVVSTLSRRIIGVEALARWNRPGYGPVSPDIFIAAAESGGLIDKLGMQVMRTALKEAAGWPDLKIAINISPVQFRNPAFAGHVVQVLEETGIAPERVMLEMTEGYFIHHPERAQAVIEKLQQIGLSIALDDFGSGFASTGYLRRFGFDRMKIDKSLVVALEEGGRSLEMLTATVALARSLGIPVTAEGIETEDQAVILQICGCDELQGYLFSKPLPAAGIQELLAQQDAPMEQLKAS